MVLNKRLLSDETIYIENGVFKKISKSIGYLNNDINLYLALDNVL